MTANQSTGNTRAAAKISREGGRVWIEGVPALVWGQGKDCTFAGALEAALSVTEHPYSYSDLMGLSGLAFRVRWCNEDTKTKWCGSTPIGEMPDEHAATEKLTGWPLPTDVQFGVENPDFDAIRRKIVASIDAGRPVPAYASCLDVAVVYGYEDGGGTLLVSDYHKVERPFRLAAEKIGPLQTYLGPHSQPPSRREALIEALKTAVVNWRRGRHDGGIKGREYLYGDDALHAWMHDLHDFDAVPDESKEAFFRLNRWNYQSLKDARLAAVAFLTANAPLLDGDAKAALERAAKLYGDELHRFALLERSDSRPWSAESLDQWTADMRNREREVLSEGRLKEAEAIAQIEKALAAEGVDVSAVLAAVGGSTPAEAGTSKATGPQKELRGYRWKPLWISQIGCLKAGMDHLGTDVSPSWLFGATGYAFLLNIHDALCPSGWHVVEMPVGKMGENAGYKLELIVDTSAGKASKAERQKQTWDGVRKAIDAGVPCYGYDLEVGDYYTVHGYDDVGYYFAGPTCTGGKGPLAWRDYGVTGQVGIVHMCAVRAGKPADDKKTVIDTLVWAVKHAQGATDTRERYASGLAGYDQWIRALGSDQIEPHGTAYNAVCYLECRRNAVRFLTEARQRLDADLAGLFDEAIGRYKAVASSLEQVAEAFPWPPDAEHIKDQARRRKAIEALQAAKQAETQGVQALAKLARALGADAELVAAAQ